MHSETLYADLIGALVCSLFLFLNLFVCCCFLEKGGGRSKPPTPPDPPLGTGEIGGRPTAMPTRGYLLGSYRGHWY